MSKIDLNSLSADELVKLSKDARDLVDTKRKKELESTKEKLLATEKFQKFKEELKSLNEEFVELDNEEEALTLLIPLKLKLKLVGQKDSLYSFRNLNLDFDEFYDLFSFEFSAQLGTHKEAKLNKVQRELFKSEVDRLAENACDEVLALFPEVKKKVKKFSAKLAAATEPVYEEMGKAGISLADLEE